jgi:hypothetical protein
MCESQRNTYFLLFQSKKANHVHSGQRCGFPCKQIVVRIFARAISVLRLFVHTVIILRYSVQ